MKNVYTKITIVPCEAVSVDKIKKWLSNVEKVFKERLPELEKVGTFENTKVVTVKLKSQRCPTESDVLALLSHLKTALSCDIRESSGTQLICYTERLIEKDGVEIKKSTRTSTSIQD